MAGAPRWTVAEHRAAVAAAVSPPPVEECLLAAAEGAVLAEDVRAAGPLPAFDNCAMDGYALLRADVAAARPDRPARLVVTATVAAGGSDPPPLRPRTAQRVMTGAPVPPGADTVVEVECTDGGTALVAVHTPRERGANIRLAGEDVGAGAVVLQAGVRLTPARLALLAALGRGRVRIVPPPRVLVISTGTELVAPEAPLRPGQVRDVNALLLAGALRRAGARAETLPAVPDDPRQLRRLVEARAGDCDLILTTGGISAGAFEVVKEAFAGRGVRFGAVAMSPGGPQGAGRVGGRPLVALPGTPVGAFVAFEVFVRPALRAAMGYLHPERRLLSAVTTEPLRSRPGQRHFRLATLTSAGAVCPCDRRRAHHLSTLAGATGLVELPEDRTLVDAGEPVPVWELDPE